MRNQIRLTLFLLCVALSISNLTLAQKQPNPFKDIGKQSDVIDISNGKYEEIIVKDSLERIGSVIVNRLTRKIENLLDENSTEQIASTSEQSRFFSVDPLTAKFPYYSPYQFAGNMPIWANDLDGLEPNFTHKGDGINGVGLFDPNSLASIPRHSTVLTIGNPGKQFQLQWLLNNNGEAVGYLASRVVPEEEYKRLYGGSGTGLQDAYVIGLDKFGDFGKNIDKYYDKSRNAEMEDYLYGEIDRDPVKGLFDPRYWLLGQLAGATGKMSGQLFLKTASIFSKAERLAIFQSKLGKASPVGSQSEAIQLINKTLDQVEDAYSGIPKAKGLPSGDDGRMYGILDEKHITTMEDGTKIANTKGNRILLKTDGGFEIQTKDGKNVLFSKPGKKE